MIHVHKDDVGMWSINVDEIIIPPEMAHCYSHVFLFKTKCGRHLIGNKRGDQWRYKSDIEGNIDLIDLPDKYEVIGWIGLD